MRALVRPKILPPTLVNIRAQYAVDRTAEDGGPPEGRWNEPDVRGAVYAIGGRVCAYCQRQASDARGDVEHFRPKSVYRWLMYEFSNYLLGCRVCNTSRKSNLFPLAPRAKPVAFRKRMLEDRDFLVRSLAREKRLLIDPAEDPVDQWVRVNFDDPLCPIEPSAEAEQDRNAQRRVATTIEFFGLNTISELITDRKDRINEVLITLEAWRNGELSRRRDLIRFANRYEPHGWAIRQVLAALASELALPSAAEDLEAFVKKTLLTLELDDHLLKTDVPKKDRAMVEARKQEKCWTLAVLWKDPPAASANDVQEWIATGGKLAEVKTFYDRLV